MLFMSIPCHQGRSIDPSLYRPSCLLGQWAIQRSACADLKNSLTRPQLLAVSATSNRQKGDKDPAEWLPDRAAYQCQYVRAWIQVKQYYGLSVDSLEKAALGEVLGGC
jgi:hypothetical protein